MKHSKNIQVIDLCKQHRKKEILKKISFEAKPGVITAFLGPNGAGKSSTLRILLGLDAPTMGKAVFGGISYKQMKNPLRTVGAVFDGIGGSHSRTIYSHLKMIAISNRISTIRIHEVLELVGLNEKRKDRLGTISLGEGQRLGLAIALLGNPQYLVLDEPMNGLDPSGMRWLRRLLKEQAAKGTTILLSSHLLSEIETLADEVVVLAHGQIVAKGTIQKIKKNLHSLEDVFFELTEEGDR